MTILECAAKPCAYRLAIAKCNDIHACQQYNSLFTDNSHRAITIATISNYYMRIGTICTFLIRSPVVV